MFLQDNLVTRYQFYFETSITTRKKKENYFIYVENLNRISVYTGKHYKMHDEKNYLN